MNCLSWIIFKKDIHKVTVVLHSCNNCVHIDCVHIVCILVIIVSIMISIVLIVFVSIYLWAYFCFVCRWNLTNFSRNALAIFLRQILIVPASNAEWKKSQEGWNDNKHLNGYKHGDKLCTDGQCPESQTITMRCHSCKLLQTQRGWHLVGVAVHGDRWTNGHLTDTLVITDCGDSKSLTA